MPIYECGPCNFSSKIKTHYNRHLKTNKHLSRLKEIKEDEKEDTVNIEKQQFSDGTNTQEKSINLLKKYHELSTPEKFKETEEIEINLESTMEFEILFANPYP